MYPLSSIEQVELDTFLSENLKTGHIHSSKLPMAVLVFLIKKMDGSVWLVQDYYVLNIHITYSSTKLSHWCLEWKSKSDQ